VIVCPQPLVGAPPSPSPAVRGRDRRRPQAKPGWGPRPVVATNTPNRTPTPILSQQRANYGWRAFCGHLYVRKLAHAKNDRMWLVVEVIRLLQ